MATLVLSVGIAVPAGNVSASAPTVYYVESTGHPLAEPFLSWWINEGGDQSLGLPVTDRVKRGSRPAQYFQFGVLVQKRDGSVTRIKAGSYLLNQLQEPSELVAGRRIPGPRTVQGFSTEKNTGFDVAVNATVAPTYRANGGETVLGRPLTVAYFTARGTVQWFEYGRVEVGNASGALAPVGLELAIELGISTEPSARGSAPAFDPTRFVDFAGDGAIPDADAPFNPVQLVIPRLQVNAGIEHTGVVNGVLTNPTNPWNVGWYSSFSKPGEWTNVVIAGHRDWWNQGPVVFWNLGLLQPGDKAYLVGADGAGATYVVAETLVVPESVDPQPIINDIGYEALTLITCGGQWDGVEYSQRIVVRAYRI